MSTTTSTAAPSSSPPRPHAVSRFFSLNNRFLAPILVTCILLVGQITFGFLESYTRTLLAIGTSIGMEMLLGRLMLGKWPHVASAYITGISVGILIRSPAFWPYVLCAMISITSKYAIRWHGRHIWNPSNLGVSSMLFLAPASVATLSVQWGNTIWPMLIIWLFGTLIIWRINRFNICATYVATFLVLSAVRSYVKGDPWLASVSPITGPMYQLYIFFMITDPKTTMRSWWGQTIVAFLIAVVEAILRLNQVVHAPYYALFLVGPPATILEIWWTHHYRPEPIPAPKAATEPPHPALAAEGEPALAASSNPVQAP